MLKDRTELAENSGRFSRQKYHSSTDYRRMNFAKIATYRYVLGDEWVDLVKGKQKEGERVRALRYDR